MKNLKQIKALLSISLKSTRYRMKKSTSTLIGSLSVTLVLVTLLAIANGYEKVIRLTSVSNHIMILMHGTSAELSSVIDLDTQTIIRQHPLVDEASPEGFTTMKLQHASRDIAMNVSFRGVQKQAFQMRPQIRITHGRMFRDGVNELMIGRRIAEQFEGMKIGESYKLGGHLWKIVGIFEAAGGLNESEIWTDLSAFQSMTNKGSSVQVMYLSTINNVSKTAVNDAFNNDPRINVRVTTEKQYLEEQSDSMNTFVKTLGFGISGLMMAAAIFASFNNTIAGIQARTKELATLKSLGFRDSSISISLMIESLLWAMVGGCLGLTISYLLFQGYSTSTLFFSHNYSQVAFTFSISGHAVAIALLSALAIGIVGSFYPIRQFINSPIPRALSSRF